MLITFEGIDGSGKSTQIELLKNRLTEAGKTVNVFREPGGTDVSELIRGMLLNPEIDIDPITEMLLFSSARSQLVAEKVLPAIDKGEIVILDRFYDSTTAYQGHGRELFDTEKITQINQLASHGKAPDITFYLKISLEDSINRTNHMSKDRMEQSGNEFFKRVISGFDELSANYDRFKIIDASKNIHDVHSEIMTHLKQLI